MIAAFPLSLYVHLPWCEQKCPYCDFNVSTDLPSNFTEFQSALLADIDSSREWIKDRKFSSIYFGGGTPSLVNPNLPEKILDFLRAHQLIDGDAEITIEFNPKETKAENLHRFLNIGFTRFSVGIQSFDDDVLQGLGRNHTSHHSLRAIEELEKIKSKKSIDLMYGCPNQSEDSALQDIRIIACSTINHLSFYQLTIEPNTVFFSKTPKIPTEDKILLIENNSSALLLKKLFEQYEVSSWSRNREYSKHNLNYWNYGDYLGIGPGSHSKFTSEGITSRFTKLKKVSSYLKDQSPKLTQRIDGDKLDMDIAMNLFRLKDGVNLDALQSYFLLPKSFLTKCKDAEKRGLLDKSKLAPTQKGFKFLNDLVGLF